MGRTQYTLLPVLRLYPEWVTSHGHPSLAKHYQDLRHHLLLGPQEDSNLAYLLVL